MFPHKACKYAKVVPQLGGIKASHNRDFGINSLPATIRSQNNNPNPTHANAQLVRPLVDLFSAYACFSPTLQLLPALSESGRERRADYLEGNLKS
eukprot:2947593-Rhodomonas_salina.2